jgi:hypothetical protein
METIAINNIKDVEDFLQFLYDEYDLVFHPDDSFEEYIDRKGEPAFTKRESHYLDSVMEKCFDLCEQNGTNIYEVMEPIQRAEFRKRGYII